jgi:diguanylate cyclase (GGDEF)-like protein
MNLISNIILNVYSIMIIIVIYAQALKCLKKDNFQDKLFIMMLNITILMLIIDIFSRFDGIVSPAFTLLNHLGNFFIFIMNPILPSIWVVYVYVQTFHNKRKIRKLIYFLCMVNGVNILSLISSQFFGWFYYIDSNNIYHRGKYFFLPVLITYLLILFAFVITLVYRKKLERKTFFSLMFFIIPPVISIILQVTFYGISIILNSIVLSLLVAFLNLQNRDINTDYLTKVNNRKKLDAYLEKRINNSTSERSFSAILIDINDFKYINDTYGHCTGDQALSAAAELLKNAIREKDFIARFGGDEFCLVLDAATTHDLEAVVSRIKRQLKLYNESGRHIYSLGLSMGYAVYPYHLHLTPKEYLKQIDLLMYEDKKKYKSLKVK